MCDRDQLVIAEAFSIGDICKVGIAYFIELSTVDESQHDAIKISQRRIYSESRWGSLSALSEAR